MGRWAIMAKLPVANWYCYNRLDGHFGQTPILKKVIVQAKK